MSGTPLYKLTPEKFDLLKSAVGSGIKDNCEFCDAIVNRDSFGFITKDITSCNNIMCVMKAIDIDEKVNGGSEKCKFCDTIISRENVGSVSKNGVTCDNHSCIFRMMKEEGVGL